MTHFPFEINNGGCWWLKVTAVRRHIYWKISTKMPPGVSIIWCMQVKEKSACVYISSTCISWLTGTYPFKWLNSQADGGKGADPVRKAALGGKRDQCWVHPEPPQPAWMSGGREATWTKSGVAVINSPCLGCRHRNETDEGLGWWMRAGARADKTWPMNLFYIIGSFDHWQKFRDGPVHLSKQTKASSLPETLLYSRTLQPFSIPQLLYPSSQVSSHS